LVALNHFTVPIATSLSPVNESWDFKQRDSSAKLVAAWWQKAVAVTI
jgi:hypothetical protein